MEFNDFMPDDLKVIINTYKDPKSGGETLISGYSSSDPMGEVFVKKFLGSHFFDSTKPFEVNPDYQNEEVKQARGEVFSDNMSYPTGYQTNSNIKAFEQAKMEEDKSRNVALLSMLGGL